MTTHAAPPAGPRLNIAHTLARSRVNGPGERFVIWVQGCSLHCRGCWNPDTWNPRPRFPTDPDELAGAVVATPGIEGLTLSGGEPFEQAEALVPVARRVRAAGLSVMAFSGYELEDLTSGARGELLALCDIAVTGPYRQEERSEDLPWRGSANQVVHFLTDRYGPEAMPQDSECEVHIAADGSLTVTGFPALPLRS